MSNSFISIQEFLDRGVRATNGKYHCTQPHLGLVGGQRVGGSSSLYIGRPLTNNEFQSFQDAQLFLGRHASSQQLIELVRRNFGAYSETMERIEKEYEADHSLNWNRVTDMVIEANRHILNFLTSMKTFLDHTETRMNRNFGKESDRFKAYKAAEHAAFDTHFPYRFVSKLRNYAQHCGMPLGWINAKSDLTDPSTGKVKHSIDFNFSRDDLLKNFKEWSRHVEPELREMPEHFPITPHMAKTAECLADINSAVLAQDENELRQHMGVVEVFLAELGKQDGMPCIVASCSAEVVPTEKKGEQKVKAGMDVQRFQMQHIEATREMLAELEKRRTRGR